MTDAEALENVRGYASAHRYAISRPHGEERMKQRNVWPGDVHSALCRAKRCLRQPNGRWKVTGPDRDGDDLDLIVVIDEGLVVVTVY